MFATSASGHCLESRLTYPRAQCALKIPVRQVSHNTVMLSVVSFRALVYSAGSATHEHKVVPTYHNIVINVVIRCKHNGQQPDITRCEESVGESDVTIICTSFFQWLCQVVKLERVDICPGTKTEHALGHSDCNLLSFLVA